MNEKQLDELLQQKKSFAKKFEQSETEFIDSFFAKIDRKPTRTLYLLRYAAGFLLAAGLTVLFAWPKNQPQKKVEAPSFQTVSEAVRLFGSDTAVMFFGNELVTGDRESSEKMANYVNIQLPSGTEKIEILLACADNDSIYLDGAKISGNVIISRSDASTLVLDMELTVDGKSIHAVIPVVRQGETRHWGSALS
ncbi:MAG: hypothetical protein PHS41_11180 [Victivallaceae bacterium]|nr:hypothetical protein [Victivallaceae bacterium]